MSQQEELWNASRADDLPAVQRALGNCADVDALFGSSRSTSLHQACRFGHLEIIRALLDAGAYPEAKADGMTPLHWACLDGQVEAARILLLEAGANVEVQDNLGWTALHFAAYKGDLDIVKVLLDAAASLELRETNGATSLVIACQEGHLETVQALLYAGADLKASTLQGFTPLHFTCQNGHLAVVKVYWMLVQKSMQLTTMETPLLLMPAVMGNLTSSKNCSSEEPTSSSKTTGVQLLLMVLTRTARSP